jgi:L-proline amide hydrolase
VRHEQAGTTDDPGYEEAVLEFSRRYVCRLEPWPDELVRTFDAIASDPTVYGTLNGPSEFTVIGALREWNITDRLSEIDVPLLLVSGEHDEVRPELVRVIFERVPRARWELFETSSHTPHLEQPERFLGVVEGFLEEAERPG